MEARFVGLDVGTRRIGVAASTPGGQMVLPVETVEARDIQRAARRIAEIVEEYEARGVVVGWPLDMRGKKGRAVERVERFLSFFQPECERRGLEIELHRWDERMTSMAADRLLNEADVHFSKRREAIDQVAACEILQGYLDSL